MLVILIHQMAISWSRWLLRYARFQLYFSAPFSKEKEPLKSNEETEKDNEVANEDTPMIQTPGWASGTHHMLDSFLPLLLSVFLNALLFHFSLVNHRMAWHMIVNIFFIFSVTNSLINFKINFKYFIIYFFNHS